MKIRVTIEKTIDIPDGYELGAIVESKDFPPTEDSRVLRGQDAQEEGELIPCLVDSKTGTMVEFMLKPRHRRLVRRANETVGTTDFEPSAAEDLEEFVDEGKESYRIEELNEQGVRIQEVALAEA